MRTLRLFFYFSFCILFPLLSFSQENPSIITNANIPCVDIINMNPDTDHFGSYHHTHRDNMDIIDKNTLKAVGQTVLEVLWEEQNPK